VTNILLVSDHMTYTSRQRNPSLSRSYSSSERSWTDMDGEKDIDNDGLTSASVGIRSKAMMMHQSNISSSTSSMGLSMAETLAQSPHHSYSPSKVCLMLNSILSFAFAEMCLVLLWYIFHTGIC